MAPSLDTLIVSRCKRDQIFKKKVLQALQEAIDSRIQIRIRQAIEKGMCRARKAVTQDETYAARRRTMKTGPNDKSPAIPRLFSRGCGAIFFCFAITA